MWPRLDWSISYLGKGFLVRNRNVAQAGWSISYLGKSAFYTNFSTAAPVFFSFFFPVNVSLTFAVLAFLAVGVLCCIAVSWSVDRSIGHQRQQQAVVVSMAPRIIVTLLFVGGRWMVGFCFSRCCLCGFAAGAVLLVLFCWCCCCRRSCSCPCLVGGQQQLATYLTAICWVSRP